MSCLVPSSESNGKCAGSPDGAWLVSKSWDRPTHDVRIQHIVVARPIILMWQPAFEAMHTLVRDYWLIKGGLPTPTQGIVRHYIPVRLSGLTGGRVEEIQT